MNIFKNCGRRPQGLRYPLPDNSTGNYLDNIECDIMENTRYISGYQCIAPCQSDPTQTAHLVCNCHMEMGPIHFIKQCVWEYKGPSCPVLTDEDKRYDWECHPKFGS